MSVSDEVLEMLSHAINGHRFRAILIRFMDDLEEEVRKSNLTVRNAKICIKISAIDNKEDETEFNITFEANDDNNHN